MSKVIKSPPRVSVIMPVYNVEAYVAAAVQSVLSQTFVDFELIAINDGSTDLSLDVVRAECAADARVVVVSQENKGLAAARNLGLEIARGSYIYFFDSDDLLEPDALALCMGYVLAHDLDLVVFSGRVLADGAVSALKFPEYERPDILMPSCGQSLLAALVEARAYASSACLYLFSRELWQKEHLKFDDGFLHEDEAFTLLLFTTACRAVSLKRCLFNRRVREHSIMTSRRSVENIFGQVQAAVKVGEYGSSRDGLWPATRSIFRQRQRGLLRLAAHTANAIGAYPEFVKIVRSRFGWKKLLYIDPLAIMYVGAGRLFFFLRRAKRAVSKVIA